jgi:hypothetical protein
VISDAFARRVIASSSPETSRMVNEVTFGWPVA